MGRFTRFSGEIDDFVGRQIDVVVGKMREEIPGLRSILLIGGYGRGEGAVEIRNGQPRLVNDFDLYAITDKYVKDEYLEELARECSHAIDKGGIPHPRGFEGRYTYEKYFHIDIHCLVRNRLNRLPPTVRYFEMKRTSAVLYGEDVRPEFPDIKASEIPDSEGLRLLMNRMMLLLMAFRPEFVRQDNYITEDESAIIAYYVAKSYLTMAEALLLLADEFEPSYTERAVRLAEIYESAFPDLYAELPDLTARVAAFTEYKLSPRPEEIHSLAEWECCRQYIGQVFRYCLQALTKKRIPSSWVAVYDLIRDELPKPYFDPYASFMLGRYGVDIPSLRTVANLGGQAYLSYKYNRALRQDLGRSYGPALSLRDPGIKILAICPLILYSIDGEGEEDKTMLTKAFRELRHVYPVGNAHQNLDWSYVKSIWMRAYRVYYLQKFV